MPVIWRGTTALVEAPNSPAWSFGESIRMARTFFGPHATCLASAPMKGAIGTGLATGMRVFQSEVTRQRGTIGQLVIIFETVGQPAQGGTLPPDEMEFIPSKVEIALKDHPFFDGIPENVLRAITLALETSDETKYDEAVDITNSDFKGQELFKRLRRGNSHYVLFPPVVQLTTHSWNPPTNISAGGVIQNPPSIPVAAPTTLKYLREADAVRFDGTFWKVVSRWVGAEDWDSTLYATS